MVERVAGVLRNGGVLRKAPTGYGKTLVASAWKNFRILRHPVHEGGELDLIFPACFCVFFGGIVVETGINGWLYGGF